jgi:hypothetical protein
MRENKNGENKKKRSDFSSDLLSLVLPELPGVVVQNACKPLYLLGLAVFVFASSDH